jgi:hypothetical protein
MPINGDGLNATEVGAIAGAPVNDAINRSFTRLLV